MSLRWVHFVFVLVCLIVTDMFGAWAVYDFSQSKDVFTLVMGIVAFALGFAIVAYAIWLVKKFDKAQIG